MMGVTVIKVVSRQAHSDCCKCIYLFLVFMTSLIWHIRYCRWCLDHLGRMSKNMLSLNLDFVHHKNGKFSMMSGVFVLLTEHIDSAVPLGVRR